MADKVDVGAMQTRLIALDEEFATYREMSDARHRRMRDVVNAIHKTTCTGTGCAACAAIDG